MRWSLIFIAFTLSLGPALGAPMPSTTPDGKRRRTDPTHPDGPTPPSSPEHHPPAHHPPAHHAQLPIHPGPPAHHPPAQGSHHTPAAQGSHHAPAHQPPAAHGAHHAPAHQPPAAQGAHHAPTSHPLKWDSHEYRHSAELNPHHIERVGGAWTTTRHKGATPITGAPKQADHLLEAQAVHKALEKQGTNWDALHPHHQKALSEILNHPTNVQAIPATHNLNQQKKNLVTNGLEGKPAPATAGKNYASRDGYTTQAMAPAAHVAHRMDRYLTANGMQGNVLTTHLDSMHHAGLHVDPKLRNIPQDHARIEREHNHANVLSAVVKAKTGQDPKLGEKYLHEQEKIGNGNFVDHLTWQRHERPTSS